MLGDGEVQYAVKTASSWYNTVIRERNERKWLEKPGSKQLKCKPNRLNPKNDFFFKKLFGEEESKEALISLLNAILGLKGKSRIKDLKIENPELLRDNRIISCGFHDKI